MLWIVGFFVVYVLVLLAITWISLHPIRIPSYISPASLDAPQESFSVQSASTDLAAWWLSAPDPEIVMIFAHGYMMNKCELTPEAVHWWHKGVASLLFDHRAHGDSGGKQCGFGYREKLDIVAMVKEARKRHPDAKIVLLGSSMGSASIALALADDPTLANAVVLDSCYSRLTSATLGWWRFLGGKFLMTLLSPTTLIAIPIMGFNPFRVDVAEALKKFSSVPILFIHGDKDNLALPTEALRNFEAYAGPKHIEWFEGCGHSEGRWLQPQKYRQAIGEFLIKNSIVRHL
jgi:pimeloyl-ACP methyl ester carboxylesterase